MKRFLLTFVIVSFAALAKAQIRLAPEAGLNLAGMIIKDTIGTVSTRLKPGLAAGAIAELPLARKIFLQPGIFYMINGVTYTGANNSITVHTIQVPVNVMYKSGEEGSTRFFVALGPYVGFNLGGYTKVGNTKTPLVVSSDLGKNNIKAIDVGATFNVGVILSNNTYARIRYQAGFTNLDPATDARYSAKTASIGITIGYYLGKKKILTGRSE